MQLLGAGLELLGLGTVASGIAQTRRRFTDRPSLAQRGWSQVQGFAVRLRKKKPQDVRLAVGSSTLSLPEGKARLTVSFGPWNDIPVEERIDRLRTRVESHGETLGVLADRIDSEEKARANTDEAHGLRLSEIQVDLMTAINQAASGSLRLETIGVGFFALGIVFATWGSIIG